MAGPITRGTIRTTFVLSLRLLVQAGTLLIVARLLGPQGFGAFAGVAALAVILGTLSSFGINTVLLGEVSRDPARREQVLPYAVPFTLLCGSVLFAVYLLISQFALREAAVPVAVLIVIGVTELWLQPLLGLPASEHLGLGRIARSQLLQTLPLALRLLAAAAVFILHPVDPLAAYAYGYLIASVVALVIATTTMPAPWPRMKRWRLPTRTELRSSAGYATLNITSSSPSELDKILATKLLPLSSAGMYAVGTRVISAATLPVIAMTLAALPRLFRDAHGQPKRTAHLLRWIFGVALAYSLALAVVLWFAAPVIVWVFGPKYHGLQHMIHWLTLAVPGMALRIAAGSVLMALGRPWMQVGFEVAGLGVLIGASIVLTQHLGTTGMALALVCSEWGMAVIGLSLVIRQMGLLAHAYRGQKAANTAS